MQSHVIQNNTGWGRERGEGRRIGKRQQLYHVTRTRFATYPSMKVWNDTAVKNEDVNATPQPRQLCEHQPWHQHFGGRSHPLFPRDSEYQKIADNLDFASVKDSRHPIHNASDIFCDDLRQVL